MMVITFQDGQRQSIAFGGDMTSKAFLRGNQAFWQNQDAVAPPAFNELMLSLTAP
jgi:hypothetical protein